MHRNHQLPKVYINEGRTSIDRNGNTVAIWDHAKYHGKDYCHCADAQIIGIGIGENNAYSSHI